MEHSTEDYCMIAALCAYVMIQSNMTVPPALLQRPELAQMTNVSIGHVLLEESVAARKALNYVEKPTHLSVLTSWFYYGCYFGLGKDNSAWSYLREATTQAQLLGMHDEEIYKSDPLDISRRRVLYWLLLNAERTHALHKHRPITLYPTIHPPSLDEVPSDRPVSMGLESLIELYKPIDDTFISLWNKVQTHANLTWISQLQSQLSEALPAYLECTEVQAVDLRITRQWLRTMVWQLCVSQGLVSSVTADSAMTFKYPIEISRDLLSMTQQFSQQAMEVHGLGLIEKLFDIACCLIDVVACIPFSPDTFALGPRDYVARFLTLFSALRGGQTRYLPLLLTKVSDVLPNLPLPRSLNIPQNMHLGLSTGPLGIITSDMGNGLLGPSAVSPSSYPSNELIRQLAAQTGAQLPFHTSQQSLLQRPSSRVDDLSYYDSQAPATLRTQSSGSNHSGNSTPASYMPSPSHDSASPHAHSSVQVPSPHSHMQGHHIAVNSSSYDPRFGVQGFPVDPSMGFKQDSTEAGGHLQDQRGMFTQGTQNTSREDLGHSRGNRGVYTG